MIAQTGYRLVQPGKIEVALPPFLIIVLWRRHGFSMIWILQLTKIEEGPLTYDAENVFLRKNVLLNQLLWRRHGLTFDRSRPHQFIPPRACCKIFILLFYTSFKPESFRDRGGSMGLDSSVARRARLARDPAHKVPSLSLF